MSEQQHIMHFVITLAGVYVHHDRRTIHLAYQNAAGAAQQVSNYYLGISQMTSARTWREIATYFRNQADGARSM